MESKPVIQIYTNLDGSDGAVFSECGMYRYKLWRTWEPNLPKVMFIMLNPATAGATNNDPTIHRCIGFAHSWGFGGLWVGNLYAYRAFRPVELWKTQRPKGPLNMICLEEMAREASQMICAWGNRQGRPPRWIKDLGKLHYLELAKDETPKHPLYLKKNLQPKPYE